MLTLVIPTKNRSEFMIRLLNYFEEVRCPFSIIIGDSSTDEHLQKTKSRIAEIGSNLNITHIVDPASDPKNKAGGWQVDNFLRSLIDYVKTPYVAFYADDDFAVVNNLQKAVDFLETHEEYSFVCGDAILFSLKEGDVHGEIENTGRYRQRGFESDLPSERISDLFSLYTVLEYGVSRTEQKKYRWNKVFDSGVDNLMGELINCSLVLIQGKVKKIDKLFLVRQTHASQTSKTGSDAFDRVSKVIFPDFYAKYLEIVADDLVKVESNLSVEAAQEVIKRAFWFYTAKGLMTHWEYKYVDEKNKVPSFFTQLKRRFQFNPKQISFQEVLIARQMILRNLLDKGSEYHKDFMPIYNQITSQEKVLCQK